MNYRDQVDGKKTQYLGYWVKVRAGSRGGKGGVLVWSVSPVGRGGKGNMGWMDALLALRAYNVD